MSEMETIAEAVKVKGKPGRKPKVQAESVDLAALLTQLNDGNKETIIALAAELRKPTELEQKKIDDEKESIRKRTLNAIAAAKEGERITSVKQANCNHMQGNNGKTDGITTFGAQVNSDGYFVPRCGKCFIQTLPIKATAGELQGGISLRSWQNVTYEGLNRLAIQRDPSVAPQKVA